MIKINLRALINWYVPHVHPVLSPPTPFASGGCGQFACPGPQRRASGDRGERRGKGAGPVFRPPRFARGSLVIEAMRFARFVFWNFYVSQQNALLRPMRTSVQMSRPVLAAPRYFVHLLYGLIV